MQINLLIYILLLSFILLINSIPTFEITEVSHTDVRCDYDEGYFQFKIEGKGTGFTNDINITLPLKSPCPAACTVNSKEMFCTMDALVNNLEGDKKVIVNEEEPIFSNLKISNWAEYFIEERRTLNSATNCWGNKDKIIPVDDEENLYAVYKAENFEILGCFRNKNNFSFQITQIKDEKAILKDEPKEDIYFELNFQTPADEKAICVIPKNKNIVRCAMDYGGELLVGKDAYGHLKLDDKKYKILIRGLLILQTKVDECD